MRSGALSFKSGGQGPVPFAKVLSCARESEAPTWRRALPFMMKGDKVRHPDGQRAGQDG